MRFELMPPIGEQLSERQSLYDCWFQAVAVNRAWLPRLEKERIELSFSSFPSRLRLRELPLLITKKNGKVNRLGYTKG